MKLRNAKILRESRFYEGTAYALISKINDFSPEYYIVSLRNHRIVTEVDKYLIKLPNHIINLAIAQSMSDIMKQL